MAYIPSQIDFSLLCQSNRIHSIKIEILNTDFKVIEYLDGELTQDSYAINADSDIRRTFELDFFVKDSSFLVGENAKIWFNKYLKIYTGIYSEKMRETVWYNMGIYIFNNYSYQFDVTTNALHLSCVDLTANLDGTMNGQIGALTTLIPMFSDANETIPNTIREVMRSTISNLGGVKKYILSQEDVNLPKELEFSSGSSIYDMVREIRDLRVGWETFFDIDATFIFQKYPTCENSPISLDEKTLAPLITAETRNNSLANVYNVTEIWGKCLSSDHYSDTSTGNGSSYSITLNNLVLTDQGKIKSGTILSFLANATNLKSPTLKVNSLPPMPIVDGKNVGILAGEMKGQTAYVVKYSENAFEFLGQFQVHGVCMELQTAPTEDQKLIHKQKYGTDCIRYVINPDSPFCVEKIGERKKVLSGNEFENIYSNETVLDRCEYETWKTTRLQDTITLELINIPWLEVNQLIEYKSFISGETNKYIVKSINGSTTNGTMTINAIKFYPLYPFIISE